MFSRLGFGSSKKKKKPEVKAGGGTPTSNALPYSPVVSAPAPAKLEFGKVIVLAQRCIS